MATGRSCFEVRPGRVAITACPAALESTPLDQSMPPSDDNMRALEVAFATPEKHLLLACRSTLTGLLRCVLVTFGDLSADIVEGCFRGRLSRPRFFTCPVGLLILLRHACTPGRSVWKAGPLEECKSGHSGGGGCFRLYSPPRSAWATVGI